MKGRTGGLSDDDRAGPVGCTEDRNDGPGIIDQGTGEQCHEIQPECPCAQAYQDHMKTIEGAEGNRGSDGKGEGRSLRRFLKMEYLFEQGLKGCHSWHSLFTVSK